MKYNLVVLLFWGMCNSLSAQNELSPKIFSGTVVNRINLEPLPDVSLQVMPPTKTETVITNHKGEFTISINSVNAYLILLIKHIGFTDQYDTLYPSSNKIVIALSPTTEMLEEALVKSIRASSTSPSTVTLLSKQDLEKQNFGQDLPMLLNLTPSTVVSSDAGAGVGYTGIRIRGIDQTRINVTINGIPLNDAESHGVYWVDLPDFASSANSIQIQRGVGSSTNGAASFGGSINIKTDHIQPTAFAIADLGYGFFNTLKLNGQFGTGILKSNWGVQGRFSAIQSDGFIDRASSDLKSVFITAAHYGEKDLLKFNFMAGHERTYQAWYGIPQPWFQKNVDRTNEFMDELYFSQADRVHLLNSNHNTYNPYTYKDEVDNYDQHHLQLFYNRQLSNKISFNSGLHYTHGYGYFEQYRFDDDFATYGLDTINLPGDTITSGNFVRRRWLDNHFMGGVFSVERKSVKNSLVVGGGYHLYSGAHFGKIIWAQYASNSGPGHTYYDMNATKIDGNLYVKAQHQPSTRLSTYADIQLRLVSYSFKEQEWYLTSASHQPTRFVFFNPKLGTSVQWNKEHSSRFFMAVSNREPVRDDFVNSDMNHKLLPEWMFNLEFGHNLQQKKYAIGVNYYYMYYRNQLVLTGAINDVGAYIRTNVPESYRVGMELEAGLKLTKKHSLASNLTLSSNKIVEFTEYVDDWNTGVQQSFNRVNTTLAFAPSITGMVVLESELNKSWTTNLSLKSVGKQFLDNSESDERALSSFTVINFQTNYKFSNSVNLGLQVNNVLNLDYAPNGYTFGAMDANVRKSYNYVYPMAGRHFMLRLTVKLDESKE